MTSTTHRTPHRSGGGAGAPPTPGAGRNRRRLWLAVTVAALGGGLFGYDTGIVSAAQLYYVDDFGLSTTMQQVVVASLLAGAVVGVVAGGSLTDRLGRRRVLFAVAGIYLLGSLASALSPDVWTLIAARVVLGLCIGTASLAVPTYIAEISPRAIRGRLVSMNQLLVMTGILVAYLVGLAFEPVQGWRWMLGLAAVPSLVMLVGSLRIFESPRWLLARGRDDEAIAVLRATQAPEDVEAELADIRSTAAEERRLTWRDVLSPALRPAVLLGVAVAATNQLIGVNAVIYYAPTLLRDAGLGDSAALLSTVGLGTAGALTTLIALLVIDRVGRRPLLLGGTAVVTVVLALIGVLYRLPMHGAVPALLVTALIVYQAVFGASLGISIWLINSEVFPTAVRGKGAAFGTITHWGLDFVISLTVLTLINSIGASGLFWIFAVCGLLGFSYLYRKLPETKGRSLEDIESSLRARGSARAQR